MWRVAVFVGAATLLWSAPVEVRTGSFDGKPFTYNVINGWAVFEGDILLGTADELDAGHHSGKQPDDAKRASVLSFQQNRWTNGVIPYAIDSDLPNPQRVLDAIQHWNDKAAIRLQPRSGEANWLRFFRSTTDLDCSSSVGMRGGEQRITVLDTCMTGALIHEIGHTVGLWHEQSRHDRDNYVTVQLANIDKREVGNFGQQFLAGQDVGPYDYSSIMHYGPFGFSRNTFPTLETNPPGIPIGQRGGLSPGDLQAVLRMYAQPPSATTVATNPAGLHVIVDGTTYTAPQSFDWDPGSSHTLSVPTPQSSDPSVRYIFGRWSDDGDQTHRITSSSSTTLYQVNMIRQYLVKTGIAASGGGTVAINPVTPDGYYTDRSSVQITAAPNPGRFFVGWSGLNFVAPPGQGLSSNPTTIRTTIANLNYVANFSTTQPTLITSDPPGRQITIDGSRFNTPITRPWNSGTTHTISVDSTTQTAGVGTVQHLFQGWSDGGSASHTVTVSSPPPTYTANFITQYLLTTSVNPSTAGVLTIIPSTQDGFYDKGTSVQLRAAPGSGFSFINWLGDLVGSNSPQSVVMDDQRLVTAVFARSQGLTLLRVVNAASFQGGGISPGEIVTLFGEGLGPDPLVLLKLNAQGKIDTTLADTQVFFSGVAAPLIYTWDKQVSAIVPYAVGNATSAQVQLVYRGQRSALLTMAVVPAVPALFTANASGTGPGAILNQDGTLNTVANPAAKDSIIALYATGEGQTDPAGMDGKLAFDTFPKPQLPVSVLIGGVKGDIFYAGAAPTYTAGLMQVNVKIPPNASSGPAVPITLILGNTPSPPGVTVSIQ